MRPEQWKAFKAAAKRCPGAGTTVAAIIDSPWIPGYLGITHLDYYLNPGTWFQANLRIMREFPDIAFFPSWWVEYGMTIEPSALGARIRFWPDRTPDVSPSFMRLEDVPNIPPIDPNADGLMPFALEFYRMQRKRILDAGYIIPAVAARGPLCLAAFLRGLTQFMTDITEAPEATHALLNLTTQVVIDWLKAQAEAAGETVEGILVLDDIVGFLSPRLYREFGQPYLKRITDAFPSDWVKVYHNDANVRPFVAELPETGFDAINWSFKLDVAEFLQKTGGKLCPMGNVAPLELAVRGTPDQVSEKAKEIVAKCQGAPLILSLGGGVSPGTPGENLNALAAAAR